MLTYSRFVPKGHPDGALIETGLHVKAHLSSVASPDDDPERFADEVQINYLDREDGWLVTGELNRPPRAAYLEEDYDPDDDRTGHAFTPWKGPQP